MNLDYYQRPFYFISRQITKEILKQPHSKRKSYWSLVPEREYDYLQSKQLILGYLNVITKEIKSIVSSKSVMYWLHLSRRILPGASGKNTSQLTVGITRKIIDSAIEKYGKEQFCECIGLFEDIDISKVFDGLLLGDSFEYERELLESLPRQLILTKFNQSNMLEYYTLEKLAYEVWKCGATLRALGKGAKIMVSHSEEDYFFELRTPELDFLIENYDARGFSFITTRKGVVLESEGDSYYEKLLIPVYNIANDKVDFFNSIFKNVGIPMSFGNDMVSNFIPIPYPFRGFYINNKPLFGAFFKKYNVEVVSVLTVVTALVFKIFYNLFHEKKTGMIKPLFLRGYQGPYLEGEVLSEIVHYKKVAFLELGLSKEEEEKVNIKEGYDFLRLENRNIIDLLFSAPMKLFLPVSEDRVIIDYSKISQILDDLMFEVRINNENFKGELFELITNKSISILPTNLCKSFNNSTKQVDYAMSVNGILVICECKLKENSIGYYKGNIESIQQRRLNVIEKSINEVNEKALWLAQNPIGKNYDVSMYKFILSVGLSAFKEFTPSKNKRYWISDTIPRVLTIEEFNELVGGELVSEKCFNLIKINSSF
jgi:hypothetical protein